MHSLFSLKSLRNLVVTFMIAAIPFIGIYVFRDRTVYPDPVAIITTNHGNIELTQIGLYTHCDNNDRTYTLVTAITRGDKGANHPSATITNADNCTDSQSTDPVLVTESTKEGTSVCYEGHNIVLYKHKISVRRQFTTYEQVVEATPQSFCDGYPTTALP